jgi:hypothetical protein
MSQTTDSLSIPQKIGVALISFVVLALLALAIFRISCIGFIENYELGYTFDTVSGKTEPLVNKDGTFKRGYVYANPFVFVYHIDLRPMQVTINANNRVLNAKLVEFNPKGFQTFVNWHGTGDYDQNILKDILLSYAYDPSSKDYDFLTVKKELKNEETTTKSESVDTKTQNDTIK